MGRGLRLARPITGRPIRRWHDKLATGLLIYLIVAAAAIILVQLFTRFPC